MISTFQCHCMSPETAGFRCCCQVWVMFTLKTAHISHKKRLIYCNSFVFLLFECEVLESLGLKCDKMGGFRNLCRLHGCMYVCRHGFRWSFHQWCVCKLLLHDVCMFTLPVSWSFSASSATTANDRCCINEPVFFLFLYKCFLSFVKISTCVLKIYLMYYTDRMVFVNYTHFCNQ